MNNAQIAQKYTADPDDRLLICRALDLARRAQARGSYEFTDFLTPAQRGLLAAVRELTEYAALSFEGGYPEAERTLGVFRPYGVDYEVAAPVAALELVTKGETPGHRDILGSLMALGLRREKLGDILASADPPILICGEEIAPYIMEQLDRIGRVSVQARPGSLDAVPAPQFAEKTATVMSVRLDSVTAEGFGLSRTRAAELIRQGAVSLNWQPCTSPAKLLEAGDRVSARGFGKIRLSAVGGQSKKGRTFITIEKYL